MHRLLTFTIALVVFLTGSFTVAAQDASPAAALGLTGYPELKVTITDSGFELSAQQVPAGFVLLTITNATNDDNAAAVLGPPAGMSMDQFLQQIQATPAPNATPPVTGGFPAFLYEAIVPGGPSEVKPGGTAQAIIQLTAGDWAVFPEGNQPPAFFSATAGSPAAATEPNAAVTVSEQEFAYTGLDIPLGTGPQIWKVVNTGQQPHEMGVSKIPDGTTLDQVKQYFAAGENATPTPGGLQESDFRFHGGVLLQSSGQTVWTLLDLPAGTYVAICFIPDLATGTAHAMEGMVTVFTVGGEATPTS